METPHAAASDRIEGGMGCGCVTFTYRGGWRKAADRPPLPGISSPHPSFPRPLDLGSPLRATLCTPRGESLRPVPNPQPKTTAKSHPMTIRSSRTIAVPLLAACFLLRPAGFGQPAAPSPATAAAKEETIELNPF